MTDNAGDRTSPPGQERSERSDTKGIALDTAWKKSPLDQAWKTGGAKDVNICIYVGLPGC